MKILYCVIAALILTSSAFAQTVDENSIHYKSVDEALIALESNPDATLTEYEGWKIFNLKEKGVYVLWSFTPAAHPAHPSAIKRSLFKKNGELFIDMDAICYSTQFFCDSLIEEFKQINENIIRRESSGS